MRIMRFEIFIKPLTYYTTIQGRVRLFYRYYRAHIIRRLTQ